MDHYLTFLDQELIVKQLALYENILNKYIFIIYYSRSLSDKSAIFIQIPLIMILRRSSSCIKIIPIN